MKTVDLLNKSISYINPKEPGSERVAHVVDTIPAELEYQGLIPYKEFVDTHPILSKLSTRNSRESYLVSTDKPVVYINFIPNKTFVTDSNINYVVDTAFNYFVPPNPAANLPAPFTLVDGTIFRVAGDGVKDLEEYTYMMISDGIVTAVPNFKTVQVLLAERGKLVEDIRVVEPAQYTELLRESLKNQLIKQGVSVEQAETQAGLAQLGIDSSINTPGPVVLNK